MIIIHGEDFIKSRQQLLEIKSTFKNEETINIEGKGLTLTGFANAIESKALFSFKKLVVVENYLSNLSRSGKEKEKIIKYINNVNPLFDLVLWEQKEISKSVLSRFPKAKILIFKLNKILFKFLESIKPNNQELIRLFLDLKKDTDCEIILRMLIRQVRLLFLCKLPGQNKPADYQKIVSWQTSKLTSQAKFFTIERLSAIYINLYNIDLKNKSGLLPLGLEKTLDKLILAL